MANVDHFVVGGQSLAVAYAQTGPVTLAPLDGANSIMFSTGVRQRPDGTNETALNGASLVAFANLFEQSATMSDGGGLPLSETICSGFAHWLRSNGVTQKLLLSVTGRSAYAIAQLKKGTQIYTNMLTTVARAKALCDAAGDTYRVPALLWIQGESDELNTTADTYAATLEQLRLDFQTDVNAITGRADVIPMFMYQFSTFWKNKEAFSPGEYVGLPGMPQTLLGVHEANPNIRLVTPTYPFFFFDNNHMTPSYYRYLGEHFARAVHRQIYQAQVWDCIRPVSIERNAHLIDIAFTGNDGPLAADYSWVTDAGMLGFTVTVDREFAPLSSARISGDNTVRLVLRTPARRGLTEVWYAFPEWDCNAKSGRFLGPRGNLRDSVGSASPAPVSNPTIYKWAAHFIKTATDVTPSVLLAANDAGDHLLVAPGDVLRSA